MVNYATYKLEESQNLILHLVKYERYLLNIFLCEGMPNMGTIHIYTPTIRHLQENHLEI